MVIREVKNIELPDLANKIAESAECDAITVLHELQNWFYRGESNDADTDKNKPRS